MCQHGSFWVASAPTCELQVHDVMRTYHTIEYIEDIPRYTLCFLYELIVSDESTCTAYQAYSLQIRQDSVQVLVV